MKDFEGISEEDRVLLDVARSAAERAAGIHRAGSPEAESRNREAKGRADFVTRVDRDAERAIVDTILDRFPSHTILAEEEATAGEEIPGPILDEEPSGSGGRDRRKTSGARVQRGDASATGGENPSGESIRWIIDPLDGTTNWLHGYPEYAVSIAGLDDEGLRLGLVLNSASGERFEAIRGAGARRNDEPIRVSGVRDPEMALVGTGFPFKKIDILPSYLEVFSRILSTTSGIRRGGSAAVDLSHLACGRLDAFWEAWLMPWDVAAGILIVREAGGIFEPLDLPGWPVEPAPGPGLHELRPGAYVGATPGLWSAFRELVEGEGSEASEAAAAIEEV